MSPKQKLITTVWCSITMVATMVLSHGHLVMREIMLHWPSESSWEGRLENALYTQGGLVFCASLVVGGGILVRGYFARVQDEAMKRRELSQREKHERSAATRHEAMLESLARMATPAGEQNGAHQEGKVGSVRCQKSLSPLVHVQGNHHTYQLGIQADSVADGLGQPRGNAH